MSRSQRAGDHIATAPPSSSRYRTSLRPKGVGSSSTKVVVGDGHQERGYDSEMVRDGGAAMPYSGYHTEQPSSKRASKDLYRAALDPRRNGARLSSMPSSHPQQSQYTYIQDPRQSAVDEHGALGDESAAEQSSSLRRVKKDKERRHRDRDREYDQGAVPASVWMAQVADPKTSRSHRRESRSRPRHEETPQQTQHDLPRTIPQDHKYTYAQHPSHYRAVNATPDYYRSNGTEHYVPATPLLSSTPRYPYVIDDRAGMASPPPVEVPHAFPSENAPYIDHHVPSTPLPLPRNVDQLRADGLIPGSPAHSHRRHRPARSEDVTAAGLFADGSEHPRPLRHRPSRSEDLRKLGLGQAPPPEEHPSHLARPVHIGRSASETTVPTQAQLATPGMYTSGLAVTPAVPAPAPARGLVMHPQLQESFAESANASRAPVNAAMASAAVANGTTDSDSSRERKRRTRRSRQPDASPAPELVESQIPKDPTPPPVVVHPSGKRQRTASGRSAVTPVPGESDEKKDDDMIVYRTPDPVVVESSRAPPIVQHIGALRAAQEGQGVGLAMFGSTTPAGIAHVGTRVEAPHVSRPEMTSAGAGAPRADAGHEPLRQVETGRTAVEVVPRRGSVLDSVIGQEERTRKPSGSGTEERSRVLLDVGGGKRTHVGVADVQRRPSPGTEVPRRPSPATEVQRRPSPATEVQRRPSPGTEDHRRPSLDKDRHAHGRKSIDSDGSLESFQSAELAASTAATHDAFYPAQDFHSARDAMSPMSNYQSIAPSVRSGANESRVLTEGSKAATVGHRPHANTIPPAALPKERTIPHKTSATPLVAPKPAEPEHRPRIPSGNMLPPPEVPVHRATVDVHMREQPSALVVDEDGRLTRAPVSAPITSTMPVRTTRTSLTMQRQPPPPAAPVASPPQTHPPPPQTHAAPPPTHVSPPQTHAQAQPDAQASALPKNMQQPQPNGSSKESLVDSANVKPGKSKSSRWFWKSKPSEPAPPKAPSPTPPQAPPTTQPRVRQTSILGGLMGQSSSSKSKSARKSPDPHAHHASEMYGSLDSTPSSLTLNLEPEPKKDESRMPRMFASVKNALRRTPSTAKISHGLSRSMSRLPGTTPAPAAPPPGAPLTRSASTNGREIPRPMSPPRVKEALKSGKDGVPPPPPIDVAATKDASVPIPAAPVSAPIITSAPAPAPVSAPPIVAPVAVPATPKPRGPETAPIKDDRRPPPKEVPIVEKVRAPTSSGARASLDQSQATVTKERRLIDANGRVIESTSRSDKRSSTQAAPPHPRAASPPLVTRPVTATRIPANQTGIFSSGPPRAPSTQPVPPPVSSSSRAQGSRSGRGSSRDYGHAPPPSSRPPRAREPLPAPVAVPVIDPSLPAPAGELGLPTPDETPRASPTREEVFEPRAHREKERERSRERRRPADIVVPPPDLGAVTAKLNAEVERQGANGGVLKFVHRQKRAVSIASLEAVTGQEAHFRSEASSIRTVTPGPGSTAFPTRDPHEATEDWRMLQLQEDMRLNTGKGKATSRRDSVASRGVLKRDRGGGVRKAGVAFDFPGPVIDEDVEDQFDAMKKVDIEMTYELERRKKRYK